MEAARAPRPEEDAAAHGPAAPWVVSSARCSAKVGRPTTSCRLAFVRPNWRPAWQTEVARLLRALVLPARKLPAGHRHCRRSPRKRPREGKRPSWRDLDLLQARLALAQLVGPAGGDGAFEALHAAAPGPADLEQVDDGRASEPDVRAQARGAEAASARHRAEDLAARAVLGNLQPQARADPRPVRLLADETQLDPAVPVAGIAVEGAPELVGGKGAADHREHVLVPVIVDVAERDRVALLQVPEAPGGRDVLKVATARVAEHLVRHDICDRRGTGAEKEVEPAVVVEVAEVRTHREQQPVEVRLARYIG